ncbi:MAG: class I SAM-dependent methyltransferase [Anaerolineae bacterium]|nr:MAG: class I SAM-dependent methyltransferase [Anaerolineae bacterium]
MIDPKATSAVRARYERIAPLYDWLELLPERRYRPWRRRFWDRVSRRLPREGLLLELGVGTGKNIAYWPAEAQITAIDFSPRMLSRARAQLNGSGRDVSLELGDAQELRYPENSFDLAAMTFVMCSVPDPVLGLREVARVVRPGGHVLLMEHVRSQTPWIGRLMDLANPAVLRTMGPNINRDTVRNVSAAGLELLDVEDLSKGGIFKIIEARVAEAEEGDGA